MEVKRKKTLAGLFFQYVVLFCVSTIVWAAVVFLLLLCAVSAGFLLPANYAELQLTKNAEEIRRFGDSVGQWIPNGCTYGVYDAEGVWQTGNFSKQEQKDAWAHYENGNIYAGKAYYRFIKMENENICIVQYRLVMRYASEMLNRLFPAPEIMMPAAGVVLFILNAVWMSQRFAKKIKRQLWELRAVMEKIAKNDLEFETKESDLQEICEIMASLNYMKDSLQEALKVQWDMEKQKQEQLSALAHDIKTPLTVIRGNAELLEEQDLLEENRECAAYILANAYEIEKYLETMRLVLQGAPAEEGQAVLPCKKLETAFEEMARQLAMAEKLPVSFDIRSSEGTVCCREEDILRAWSNLVCNAAEYTKEEKGIAVSVRTEYRKNQRYLVASVRDYGAGFSAKDLRYAAQDFYSGDASRHDRRHSGLGLSIAKRFAKEQGGFFEYGNCSDGAGAWASLWLAMDGQKI